MRRRLFAFSLLAVFASCVAVPFVLSEAMALDYSVNRVEVGSVQGPDSGPLRVTLIAYLKVDRGPWAKGTLSVYWKAGPAGSPASYLMRYATKPRASRAPSKTDRSRTSTRPLTRSMPVKPALSWRLNVGHAKCVWSGGITYSAMKDGARQQVEVIIPGPAQNGHLILVAAEDQLSRDSSPTNNVAVCQPRRPSPQGMSRLTPLRRSGRDSGTRRNFPGDAVVQRTGRTRDGEDSLLVRKLHAQSPLRKGSLAAWGSRTVKVGRDATTTLGAVAGKAFLAQEEFGRRCGRIGRSKGVLAKAPEVKSEVYEFQDSFAVVRSTKVLVSKPRQLADASPQFRSYLEGRTHGAVRLSDLGRESVEGLDAYMRTEVPRLPTGHPLRIAAGRGREALLEAIAEGQGDFEIVDTLIVPRDTSPAADGAIRQPVIRNGLILYNAFQGSGSRYINSLSAAIAGMRLPMTVSTMVPMTVNLPPVDTPTVERTGRHSFRQAFLAGFTRGNAWEWERRWNYPSGFFRITLGASYGIGLRIPIDVTGELSPTDIRVQDSEDRAAQMMTRIRAVTLDANADFYRRTGLPEHLVFNGHEAVLNAEFGLGYKFRVFWEDILYRRYRTYGINYDQDFRPPFGDERIGPRLEIPSDVTRTNFRSGALDGEAQMGLSLRGQGTVNLDFQPFIGSDRMPTQRLEFTRTDFKTVRTCLPARPMRSRMSSAAARYGFRLFHPSYRFDLSIVPEVRVRVRAHACGFSRTFSTGWVALNSFRMRLGTVSFNHHDGTTSEYRYADGVKRFRRIVVMPRTGSAGRR